DCLLEPERIRELGAHVLECVAPARDPLQDVPDAEPAPASSQYVPLLPEAADMFAERHRRRQHVAGGLELGRDGHVVAIDVTAMAPTVSDVERAVREPHPDPGDTDDRSEERRVGKE